MDTVITVFLVITGIVLFSAFFKILKTPLKWALKLLLNAVMGFVSLFIINFLGSPLGIDLGINWINAVIVGILGFPGVILLLVIKYIF